MAHTFEIFVAQSAHIEKKYALSIGRGKIKCDIYTTQRKVW